MPGNGLGVENGTDIQKSFGYHIWRTVIITLSKAYEFGMEWRGLEIKKSRDDRVGI